MKFGVVNKSTTVNRFVHHTLQRNTTHLAVITHKTNIKLGTFNRGGGLEKSQKMSFWACFEKFWKQNSSSALSGAHVSLIFKVHWRQNFKNLKLTYCKWMP